MMILYIAEKPSVGRAVADVLPKPQQKGDGFIKAGNGDVVTWCIGHLLEQAEPEAYNPEYKKWRKEHLPIIPVEWKQQIKRETSKQFTVVKKLIKEATLLVNMGDPDRVGQILVDEVINYSGVSKAKREATKRCLINDMNPAAIQKALKDLRQNTDFIPLATSALARARADWLYGINMTRLCTLLGQEVGYQGVLSIGRVQTPVLGLVVHRDQEIENFVSKPFYEVFVTLQPQDDLSKTMPSFRAKWKPSKACEPYMDEDGRVLIKQLAETVIQKVTGKTGIIKAVSKDQKKQYAPLPYSLSALQIDASKRFNLNAQKTLDICQQLYERHKLITYPRSDCRYLPSGHYADRQQVAAAVRTTSPALTNAVNNADLNLKSKAWNDGEVGAHHAIIPTATTSDVSRLTKEEQQIYELIARQYLMQFYPPFVYAEHQIDTEIAGGLFIAREKTVISQGWKSLLYGDKNNDVEADFSKTQLPDVKVGDAVDCIDATLDEKQTTPPKHFTDATLLAAMTGIARYVTDPEIKKILKETDGLGTEATRAGIIELLFKRQFVTKVGKEIHATPVGKNLINSLPKVMVVPDMTAHWEAQLEAICKKKLRYQDFMNPLVNGLSFLLEEVDSHKIGFKALNGLGQKPNFKKRTKRSTSPIKRLTEKQRK
ncbi:DNA topoisomerase III [Vibrio cholerae]|nr:MULTISPECIES: DNA topoisomerase III [Vibrio]MDG2573393.1 DNA topoisomerase III [Vibrio parahaemolyticus]EHV2409168.1 DNA topoisomerase III [Vibrio cholerae]EJL6421908.1 DNA topoisomerase III [Vibrio cholerae]EJL6904611.1 DNA topoisomerase III [Vibrio cholerae]EJL6977946.1 DNA topoisomerase III [Vibrio cholerae]